MIQLYHFGRLKGETAGSMTHHPDFPGKAAVIEQCRGYRWAGSFGATSPAEEAILLDLLAGGHPRGQHVSLSRQLRPPIRRFQRIGRVSVVPFHIPWSTDRRDVLTRQPQPGLDLCPVVPGVQDPPPERPDPLPLQSTEEGHLGDHQSVLALQAESLNVRKKL